MESILLSIRRGRGNSGRKGIDSIDHDEREKLIYDKDDVVVLAFPQNTHITHRRAARDEGVYTYTTSEKKGGRLRNTPNAPNLQNTLRTNRRREGLKIKYRCRGQAPAYPVPSLMFVFRVAIQYRLKFTQKTVLSYCHHIKPGHTWQQVHTVGPAPPRWKV